MEVQNILANRIDTAGAMSSYDEACKQILSNKNYASRMISSQYGTVFKDSNYDLIKKVSSIWICTQPPKYRQNTIVKYGFTEEVVYGNVKEDEDNYDLISVVIICLLMKETFSLR